MKYTLLIVCVLFITACQIRPGTNSQTEVKAAPRVIVPDTLHASKRLHAFSDPARLDTFKLEITGKDFMNGVAKVQIVSAENVLIYLEEFNTAELADYGMKRSEKDTLPPTQAEKLAHVKRRVNAFFDQQHFSSPALKAGTAFDPAVHPDREFFDELKSRPKAVAFSYVLGADRAIRLAYSEKLGKAMVFSTALPEVSINTPE